MKYFQQHTLAKGKSNSFLILISLVKEANFSRSMQAGKQLTWDQGETQTNLRGRQWVTLESASWKSFEMWAGCKTSKHDMSSDLTCRIDVIS